MLFETLKGGALVYKDQGDLAIFTSYLFTVVNIKLDKPVQKY